MSDSSKHKSAMAKLKAKVDENIAAADIERGVAVLLTGDGKGKSTSAFGTAMRALGHGQKVGIVQFIKGEQLSGEELFIQQRCPEVLLYQMATGFTWDTQDKQADIKAAQETWSVAAGMLKDPLYDLVILDELTYMLAFNYLDETDVIEAITHRPSSQSVVVTGRGGGKALRDAMDTVSEIKSVKHAFEEGVKARSGVDY